MQEITVEVLDAGKCAKARRYAVNVRFEGGGDDIIGNSAATLDKALSDVGRTSGSQLPPVGK